MNKLIEFKHNGFIYEDKFYAYQGISYIECLTKFTDDDTYHVLCGCCDKLNAKAYKQYYFKINLINEKPLYIGYRYEIDLFQYIERNGLIGRFLFGKIKAIKNSQIEEFQNTDTEQMKKDLKDLKITREELIENFNNWKK